MSKFEIGNFVEVISINRHEEKLGIKVGSRGYILDRSDTPYVNFIDKSLDLEECYEKSVQYSVSYCYPLDSRQLKLVKGE